MSAFPPDPLQAATGPPDALPRPPRVPLLLVLLHVGMGGVAVALAVSEDFATGKATFAGDSWRLLLGLVGAALAFLGVRGFVRNLNQSVPTITEQRRRTARIGGRLLIVAGAGFVVACTSDPLAAESIDFDSWAQPVFLAGGIYLLLLGLVLQLNPTGMLARQRLAQGQGMPATAKIVSASDTGLMVNDRPRVRIDFEIDLEGRVVPASQNVVMEQAKLALLIPGSTVDVLVDLQDPRAFEVDWESWRGPGTS